MRFTHFAAPVFIGAASLVVSIVLALPVALPGRPATLVLLPGQQQSALAAMANLDPEARLVGIRAGGLLLTIVYTRTDLPAQLTGAGVVAVIGDGRFGCHA